MRDTLVSRKVFDGMMKFQAQQTVISLYHSCTPVTLYYVRSTIHAKAEVILKPVDKVQAADGIGTAGS